MVPYPFFFTFCARDICQEDPIFRHSDLSMAHELECARLLSFKPTKFGFPNRSTHAFDAQDKSVGRRKGATVTGKPGRTEESGRFRSWSRGQLALCCKCRRFEEQQEQQRQCFISRANRPSRARTFLSTFGCLCCVRDLESP